MKAIDRIYQYIDYKKINKSDFEKKCGISNGYLGKMHLRNADIGESILVQVIENCPDMSPEWLIIGTEPMLKNGVIEEKKEESEEIPVKIIDNSPFVLILDRCEALAAENALLKQEVEQLKQSRGKYPDTIPYTDSTQKLSTSLAAEPAHK